MFTSSFLIKVYVNRREKHTYIILLFQLCHFQHVIISTNTINIYSVLYNAHMTKFCCFLHLFKISTIAQHPDV